jgi:hypothetical protein
MYDHVPHKLVNLHCILHFYTHTRTGLVPHIKLHHTRVDCWNVSAQGMLLDSNDPQPDDSSHVSYPILYGKLLPNPNVFIAVESVTGPEYVGHECSC